MRITSGEFRGRRLISPAKGEVAVRPTSDKIRQAIFNMLLSRMDLEGANVMDIFCGTGALGLESLSRGAAFCTFTDRDTALVKQNVKALDVAGRSEIIQHCHPDRSGGISSSNLNWLRDPSADARDDMVIDLIFMDPPYKKGLIDDVLPSLLPLAHDETIFVFETEAQWDTDHGQILQQKIYDDTKVTIWQK